ncbi:unnamed protein product, partial [Menidia menidia]
MWKRACDQEDFTCFPQLDAFLCSEDVATAPVKLVIVGHLANLISGFHSYFADMDEKSAQLDWMKFGASTLTQFWVCVRQEHPELGQKALEQLLPFASTYLCEASFSAMMLIKTKQRNRLCLEKSLITAVASLPIRMTKILRGSGQRKLNLLTPEEEGYTGASFVKSWGGKGCLYIMPIQNTLDISPLPFTAVEFQAMPKARCVSCQEYVPLQLLSLHVKTCIQSKVKVEVITLGLAGGATVKEIVWRILKQAIKNDLAKTISWRGLNGKVPFEKLHLRAVVTDAVRRNPICLEATDLTIADAIKRWFYWAGDREGGRKNRLPGSSRGQPAE